MALLTKQQYADIYRREEYNPKGCVTLMCIVAAIIIIWVIALLIWLL